MKADDDATYYISGKDQPVIIQTDTDFGQAKFIIDDREVENRNASVFLVSSDLKPFKPEGITSLKRNQQPVLPPGISATPHSHPSRYTQESHGLSFAPIPIHSRRDAEDLTLVRIHQETG